MQIALSNNSSCEYSNENSIACLLFERIELLQLDFFTSNVLEMFISEYLNNLGASNIPNEAV